MAYFLGIKTEDGFKPLKIYDKVDKLIDNSILALVKFTSNFSDSFEMLEYLQSKNLIDNYRGKFYYLIDKGQKGNKSYNVVPGTEGVIYSDNAKNFSIKNIRSKLHNKSENMDFIDHLYAFYLKKFGISNKCVNYFRQMGSSPYELDKIINNLLKSSISDELREYLYKLLEILDRAISRNAIRFFEDNEAKEFYCLLDNLESYIMDSDKDTIIFCEKLSDSAKTNQIGSLLYLRGVYHLSHRLNENRGNVLPSEIRDLDYYIDQFLNFTVYSYDKKKSAFKTINGRKKVQERNLFDLGVFLSDYDEFEIYLYQSAIQSPSTPLCVEGDHEEFLEEEDFTRMNTTSEEQGITLRMTDDKKKW